MNGKGERGKGGETSSHAGPRSGRRRRSASFGQPKGGLRQLDGGESMARRDHRKCPLREQISCDMIEDARRGCLERRVDRQGAFCYVAPTAVAFLGRTEERL